LFRGAKNEVVASQPKLRGKKVTSLPSVAGDNVLAMLETLKKIGSRPIRSAKSVDEVTFGQIYADGVYNAE